MYSPTEVWDKYADDVVNERIVTGELVRAACKRHIEDLAKAEANDPKFPYEFSVATAKRVMRFFGNLRLTTGMARPTRFVPEPWQQFILASLFGWVRRDDGMRRFRSAHIMVARKNGKMLCLKTLIPTPLGMKQLRDVHEGDVIFGVDGKPCSVLAESEISTTERCFEIEFSSGEIVIAGASHQWETTARVNEPGNKKAERNGWLADGTRKSRTERKYEHRIRTTEELFRTQTFGDRGDVNHSIRLSKAVETPEQDLLIHPYTLGVWLGDGSKSAASFVSADEEIVDRIRSIEGFVSVGKREGDNKFRHYGIIKSHFVSRLKSLGVFRNKHIPETYLSASVEQRMELLRGLMDTDGFCSKAGSCVFSNTNECLARQVKRLVCSLGIKAAIREDRAKLYGKDCGPCFDVIFCVGANVPVFHLSRKKKRQRCDIKETARSTTRQIVSVREVPSVPTKCLCVDGPDHLYLVGEGYIPTHNSHLLAGIGLYVLVADKEFGAQIYSVATKKDQAKMIWDAAVEFRRSSSDLAEYIKYAKSGGLYVTSTNSKFAALSSDEQGLDGLNVHLGLIDELQEHKTDVVYSRIDTSTTARRQPLIISIATAGTDRQSICWRQHEYSANVVRGAFHDDKFFSYIAEVDEGDDWEDEDVWLKANPNWKILNIEDLRRKAQVAKNQPSALNNFKRLHLNIWTSQDKAWMPMHVWRECVGKVTTTNAETSAVSVVDPNNRAAIEDALLEQWRLPYAGLDLSERGDITALSLLYPPTEKDPFWVVLPYYFLPEDGIEKRIKNDRVPYDVWIREGRIYVTPGATVDYDFVRAEILRLHRKTHIMGLAVDPHNALQLNQQLRGEGVPVVEVQQGWRSLSDPTKELMSWAIGRKIHHLGEPVLSWMMSNMVVWQDAAGNIRPDKEKARERIDGVSALVDAMFLALSQAQSVYSSRGIISI